MAMLSFLTRPSRGQQPDPSSGGAILDLIRAGQARKANADLWLRYYRDRQTDDLLALIKERWSSPEDFRLFCVNIVRKIVDRRAMVYRSPPFRTFDGWDQSAGEAFYGTIGANVCLKKANSLTRLLKTCLLQVRWTGTRPALSVVTPNVLDVVCDDPEEPLLVIVTRPGATETETTYSCWAATTFRRLDWRGRPVPVPGNQDGVNPYGVLPFVPLFDRAPDDGFFLDGGDDLIEAQQAINVGLTNLWRAIEWQSHGQPYTTGLSREDVSSGGLVQAVGPTHVLNLPQGATFGFAQPNTPIAGVLTAIEFLIKQTAVANDLAPSLFDLDHRAESGAAKVAESRDLLEAREDDLELWRGYEARLFDVLKRVTNTHAPGSIPEGATLRIDFGEVRESLDEGARLEAYQRRLDLGIWSPVDVVMADNPNLRDRDEALALLQRRREEASLLGAAFAGPAFTTVRQP